MKKITLFIVALFTALCALAQTPKEIISLMESAMDRRSPEGVAMTIDAKVPIMGTMVTKSYNLGGKLRLEASMMGVNIITITDGTNTWTYNSKTKEVVITGEEDADIENDAEMFHGITKGYDVSIKKQTDQAWYLQCKKTRDNSNKDDPKSMEVVVAKGSYCPISLKTKVSGVTLTLHSITFGVPQEKFIFRPTDFPNATIIDKRQQP